jgi:trans-aconitate 2-methyltransferase
VSWNPEQYLKFREPRLRPAVDLLARVDLADPKQVVDLGCGAGNVTRLLQERWPAASITGVDASRAMLAKAASAAPGVTWVEQGIADFAPNVPADLIFSNAALHWIANHGDVFAALVSYLNPRGVLAVQMPRNFSAPSHRLIADTVLGGPWRTRLEGLLAAAPVSEPQFYYELLAPLSGQLDIWETEYLHVLHGADPVKEWTKGSWLNQFLERLEAHERAEFEQDYAKRLRAAYPQRGAGETLLPFRRLFIVAQTR